MMENREIKPWIPAYSVGIDFLDDDHRILIGMINTLHQALIAGKSQRVVAPMLSELQAYTIRHFEREEAYLKESGSPDLEVQMQQHAAFTNKIKDFSAALGRGDTILAMEVMLFLDEWLRKHILNTDMKYAKK